ncbi:phosphonate metabolism protein [Methylobacterium sp. Leaf113]|nr:phosphonate metabolism protein [Methylobacterium sp. Leaf113]
MDRYALYFTPAPGSALAAFGDAILGPGPGLGSVPVPGALADLVAAHTAAPRVYGFHATLKAPMRLRPGMTEADVFAAAEALAAHRAPLPAGPLRVAALGDFLALVPAAAPPALSLLAAECVAALDPLRAPLTDAERARRRPERLDPRGRALLERWGYPHVFEAFRFHMTLTERLNPEARAAALPVLAEAAAGLPDLVIDGVSVVGQAGAAPFHLLRRLPFRP